MVLLDDGKVSEKEARDLSNNGQLCKALVNCAIASVADLAVIPMQDVLGLGTEARMNIPNTTGSNWSWRIAPKSLTKENAEWLAFVSDLYGRNVKKK